MVDRHGKGRTAVGRSRHIFPGLDGPVDGSGVAPDDGGESLGGGLEAFHASKGNAFCKSGKRNRNGFCNLYENHALGETLPMSIWPQRARFVELVKARVKGGTPLADIAAALDMAPSTLEGYMVQQTRPAKKKALDLAADYFQVDIAELWGREMTDEELELRHARAMLRDALGSEAADSKTDDQVLKYYRLAKAVISTTESN